MALSRIIFAKWLENKTFLVENDLVNTYRRRHKAAIVAAMLIFSAYTCFADIRTDLPLLGRDGGACLPIDSRIGQTVQADSSEQHVFLSNALAAGVYDYDWMEAYVAMDSREDVSKTIGQWLSGNLPAGGALMSKSVENGDGSVSISVRIDDDVVCFVVGHLEGFGFRIIAASIV